MDKMYSKKWHNVVMRYYSHLFQMPPKKVKHGGARVDAGRKSVTGEYSNDKTMEFVLERHLGINFSAENVAF